MIETDGAGALYAVMWYHVLIEDCPHDRCFGAAGEARDRERGSGGGEREGGREERRERACAREGGRKRVYLTRIYINRLKCCGGGRDAAGNAGGGESGGVVALGENGIGSCRVFAQRQKGGSCGGARGAVACLKEPVAG